MKLCNHIRCWRRAVVWFEFAYPGDKRQYYCEKHGAGLARMFGPAAYGRIR